MAKEVHMRVPEMKKFAKELGSYGDTLQVASAAIEAAISVVATVGWTTVVGGVLKDSYLGDIKPNVDKVKNKMYELQKDVQDAINHYEKGDTSGSTHFR